MYIKHFTAEKIYRICIKIRQNDYKSKKMLKMRQKFDFGIEPKVTSLHPTYFTDHCYAFGLLL